MDELLKQIQEYIKAYKELPYGKEVEGTTEILEKSSQTLIKTAHRVVLLENQFIDGMKVKYQGDDEMDGIECPICKYEVARNDDYTEMRPKHCPECGTKVVIEKPVVTLDKVQFSAVAPKTFVKGDYSVIEIMMYEEGFQHVVQDLIANADESVKETKSGVMTAEREAKITIVLSSPDLEITDNTESHIWQGGYLNFSFAVEVPEEYAKRQILFVASVYINDIIATRLKFVAKCKTLIEQKMEITREDILSAFVSYASQDRKRVARIIQGMKKARPDMDIFFDVESLRSGDDWKKKIRREIDKKDILFLCWSKYARDSEWVDYEWRSALKIKGADSIEPIPIEPPESCPPPDELDGKHFSDKLLYIINLNFSATSDRLFDRTR